jgi:hypothetical protein
MKNLKDPIRNRNRDLPTRSAVPQPTAPTAYARTFNRRVCVYVYIYIYIYIYEVDA